MRDHRSKSSGPPVGRDRAIPHPGQSSRMIWPATWTSLSSSASSEKSVTSRPGAPIALSEIDSEPDGSAIRSGIVEPRRAVEHGDVERARGAGLYSTACTVAPGALVHDPPVRVTPTPVGAGSQRAGGRAWAPAGPGGARCSAASPVVAVGRDAGEPVRGRAHRVEARREQRPRGARDHRRELEHALGAELDADEAAGELRGRRRAEVDGQRLQLAGRERREVDAGDRRRAGGDVEVAAGTPSRSASSVSSSNTAGVPLRSRS